MEMASGVRSGSGRNILLDIRPGQAKAEISGPCSLHYSKRHAVSGLQLLVKNLTFPYSLHPLSTV